MTKRVLLSAVAILTISVALRAQTSSAIPGLWQAEKRGSPWLVVDVTSDHDSNLGGTAAFYVLESNYSVSPKVLGLQEARITDAKLAGNIFSFKVRNQQAGLTLNPSSGELLSFEMILNDETHATLKSSSGSDVPLVKKNNALVVYVRSRLRHLRS